MNSRIAIVVCLVIVLGCSTASRAQHNSTYGPGGMQALPTLPPQVRSYSVGDIGKDGVPKLTQGQLATIKHIQSQLPPSARRRIRFVFSGTDGQPKTTFYVVDPAGAPPNGIIRPGTVETFRVLNEGCNRFYDPLRDVVFTAMQCGPFPQIHG